MTRVAEAIRVAAQALAATSDTARLDAEVLMAHALGISRSDLLLRRMADAAPAAYAPLVERRLAREPVAYITGRQEFFGLPLQVSPAVLIPRRDSEVLVEAALAAGGILAGTGVLTAVRVLVGHKPPNVKLTPAGGFEIRFE